MAINTSSLLSPISQLRPFAANIDLSGGQTEYQRQHLALLQQQFEEAKRHAQEEEQFQRLKEQGEMARANLAAQQQREKAQAELDAENMKARRSAYGDAVKAADSGNLEGVDTAASQLAANGGYAQRIGEVGGFPSYRLGLDASPQSGSGQAPTSLDPMSGLGYDTLGARDPLTPSAAPQLSTEDAFRQAQSAGGRAVRGPDPTDFMGGVPSDVIDTGALQAQRAQRLGPVMAGIAQMYPESHQPSVEASNQAAVASGLPTDKSIELAGSLRGHADPALQQEAQRDFETKKAAAAQNSPEAQQKLIKYGETAAEHAYKNTKIQGSVTAMQSAKLVSDMLSDDDPYNDEKAINYMMVMSQNKGAQSEADAARMTGLSVTSTAEQIRAWLKQKIEGGYYEPIRASMKKFVQDISDQERDNVYSYIDHMHQSADGARSPLVGEGYAGFVSRNIPQWLLDEYDQEAAKSQGEEGAQGAAPTDASYSPGGDALEEQAAANGYDANAIRRVVGGESGGDPTAASKKSSAKGAWQALDETAQRFVNPRTGEKFKDSAELSKLDPAEQYKVLMQYLSESGVTPDSPPEDYALAIAAPAFVGKSANEDAVVYKKGSKEWEANKPWRPGDGGDITVGSIIDYYFGNKAQKTAAAPAQGNGKAKGADDAKLLEGL